MGKVIPGQLLAQEEVKSSSSNNVYIITLYDNCISCNCPAGGRKTLCKHAISVLTKNLELLRSANIEFYNKIDVLLQLKKNGNKEDYKKLSEEVIFVNKETAEQAHNKAVKIKNSKDNIFIQIIDSIESNFNNDQKKVILDILPYLNDNIRRTEIYLKRRLNEKKTQEFYNALTDEFVTVEEDYIVGGKLINELLEKYKERK